ncbi:amino acid adenylation domain-containing protein [Nocardia sp. NPDC004068]|uniref:non-ribosomal peptide synthetase n=1 Tax=Nocardia sp. NPDC004068 TaxID=3364303 RepID=UPI00367A51A2
MTEQAWWTSRFAVRYPESGPPLFKRRSGVYRRKSKRVRVPAEPLANRPDRDELLLAAVAAVLFRYHGGDAPQGVVLGVRSAGPDVPLLIAAAPGDSFDTLRDTVRKALAESATHPLDSSAALLESLGMAEVTNRNPLYPVLIRAADAVSTADVRNDVTITLDAGDTLDLEYNANVLDEDTVLRFGGHVVEFLKHALAQPDRTIGELEYLPPAERDVILTEWSGGEVGAPDPRCAHELVEQAVDSHPDAPALVFGELTLTYREVEERANRLANHLRALGVEVGARVGLCVPANHEMVLATLAILKAGAAAVPIVPTFPAARNRVVVADSRMTAAVTVAELSGLFGDRDIATVCLDADAATIARAAATRSAAGARPSDLIYLNFTSGSTGRPKGVAIEHRTLVNLVRWQRERGIDPAGRTTLQRTSIGFDVSFQEIFATWAHGGCLLVASDEMRDDVSLLPEVIDRHRITRLFLPAVALDQMAIAANLAQRSLDSLDEVIVAGEQLQISMPIRRLFHRLDCRLDNQYGPTETHVVTAHALTGPSTKWPELPPIGRPITNVRVYVLDSARQPVAAGVPGEIHVGGLAPARGYLDPERTAEAFVPDPFRDGDHIMYRTGDLARYLPDGTIEFLGRRDDQVKIRGYRIELADIEAHLLRVPGVRHAAVAVHDYEGLGRQLSAYLVGDDDHPDPARVREQLLEVLPGHMVPATSGIVFTTVLPTTPTGKVDRGALPRPPRESTSGGPLRGDTQQNVAKVWAQALGMDSVGPDDNFIDLGGHSRIGIQVVAQLNEMFSVAVPLRVLLRGTTVAALAAEIDRLRGAATGPGAGAETPAAATASDVLLPDGRTVVALQPAETRYLYLDVTERRTYDRGGIRYPSTGRVFDVGAHIGLFTLHALAQSPRLEVFAFEPCPPLFDALRANTRGVPNVRLFPFGLGRVAGTADLTFYPNLTGMSSFHPDAGQERELLAGIIRNLGALHADPANALLAASREYLDERTRGATYACEVRTLSEVIAETGTDRIALLKIDVQKAELDVLLGLRPADWDRIEQVVVEVHDLNGMLAEIAKLLVHKGFRVTVDQDALHAGTAVHFVYAVRQ